MARLISLLLMIFFFSACFHESETGGDSALSGTWKQGCLYDPEEDWYDKQSVTFEGNHFTFEGELYEDAACSMSIFSMEMQGTYEVGSEKILTSGETVNEIDLTLTSASLTVSNEAFVLFLNMDTTCGKANWEKDVAQDIFGCEEMGTTKNGYDIYKVDGNNLFLGDTDGENDGESVDTRPTELDSDFLTKS